MRNIIEQHQPCPHRVFKVQDIQAGRGLIQSISVSSRVKSQQAAQNQANGGFMGYHRHSLPCMLEHNFPNHWQRSRHHHHPRFAPLWRKCKGIFLPCGIFFGILRFNIHPAHGLPVPVMNLPQSLTLLGNQVKGLGNDGRGFNRPAHGAAVKCHNRIIGQPFR